MEIDRDTLRRSYASKSDRELSALHGTGSLTELAYATLEAEMRARGLSVPARPAVDVVADRSRRHAENMTLRAHWEGRAPLASAYWLIGTLGGLIVGAVMTVIEVLAPGLGTLGIFLFMIFTVFASVSIWRCAPNTGRPFWGHVARLMVVLNALFLVLVGYQAYVVTGI